MKTYPGTFVPSGRTTLTHTRPLNVNRFWFGVCYYPEHWDEATRALDASRMQAAGINVVRMAEFAWDLIEPSEGRFDFSLFDDTIRHLAGHGISTILCTPTATPPRWLTQRHPEILRQDANRVPLQHGSRQHASYAHPLYRRHSRRITRAMAKHFRKNPAVVGWQTDNEIYCHFVDDHGPEMQAAFRDFLKRKFQGDVAGLNRDWGTAFWAQTYTSFDQIETPRANRPTYPNPAQQLDFARFLSDVVENFQHDQVEILRAANPAWFIFHNGIMRKTDYRGPFSQDLDFLGYDAYPFFVDQPLTRSVSQAFNCDRVRSYAGNFIVPEHQCGSGSQANYAHNAPEPGELRKITYASIARGADSLLYFRWRTCRFGAEIYWTGVLDHDNVPRRRYDEVAQIGSELKTLGPEILGTSVFCDVAVATGDYDVREAHETYPMGLPSEQFVAETLHRQLWEAGYAVGAIHPEDDLSGIKLYFLPHWTTFDPAWVPNLRRFVEAGGTLVIGARTATRDLNNNVVAETLPGCLRELVGASVEEYGKENAGSERPKDLVFGTKKAPADQWSEWLSPDPGTKGWAKWQGRHFTGKAGITLKTHGRGRVFYVGTYLTETVMKTLLPEFIRVAGLKKLWPSTPRGVQVVKRVATGKILWFFLNHNDKPVTLRSLPAGKSLLTAKSIARKALTLSLHGVEILLQKTDDPAQ